MINERSIIPDNQKLVKEIFSSQGGFVSFQKERINFFVTEENNGFCIWWNWTFLFHCWRRDESIMSCYQLSQEHFNQYSSKESYDQDPIESISKILKEKRYYSGR